MCPLHSCKSSCKYCSALPVRLRPAQKQTALSHCKPPHFLFLPVVHRCEIYAQEYGPGIRGQMSFEDVDQNMVEINGNMVDTETGEIKEDGVIDLRGAKQA